MNPQFITHLIELRKRLIYSLCGIIVIFALLFPWANELYNIIALPLRKFLPPSSQIIATDIIAPFLVPMKLTAILAFALSLPYTIYQLWKFIAPGLYQHERKLASLIITVGMLLFIIGILFCYFVALPALFNFTLNFKSSQISLMADMAKYMNLVLSLFMVFGIAFEMPLITFVLIKLNIISLNTAKSSRKYVFLLAFIISAIVTPPDIISQIILAIPLYLLYELGLLAAKLLVKK